MAAKGLFIYGFSQEDILQIQSKAKSLLLEGKTLMSWSDGGGTSVSKQFAMPVAEVLEECQYALAKLKPSSDTADSSLSRVPFRLPL